MYVNYLAPVTDLKKTRGVGGHPTRSGVNNFKIPNLGVSLKIPEHVSIANGGILTTLVRIIVWKSVENLVVPTLQTATGWPPVMSATLHGEDH